jgi:hypothetical protein
MLSALKLHIAYTGGVRALGLLSQHFAMYPSKVSTLTRRAVITRSPQRISITIPWETHRRLTERSDEEGRSISNLASYLLERGLIQ